MSPVPPTDTALGNLKILEIYIYYDGPRFFLCRNEAGQRFFAISVDEDDSSETYIYIPISGDRLVAAETGLLSLQEVVLHPEDGKIAIVRELYDPQLESHRSDVSFTGPESIPPEWLPDSEALIHRTSHTQRAFNPDELLSRSLSEGRSYFAVRLSPPDYLRTEYSIRPLGQVLKLVQDSIDALAQELEGEPTQRGAIPERIQQDSEFSLIDLEAASFVILLSPTQSGRLLELPLARQSAYRLLELLDESEHYQELRESLERLGLRARTKLRELVEEALDQETGLSLFLFDPDGTSRRTEVSRERLREGLDILTGADETIENITLSRAQLVGVNLRTKFFELLSEENGEKFSGRVEEDLLPDVEGLTVGGIVRAEIRAETTFLSYSSETRTKYRLTAISVVDSERSED